MSRLGTRQKNKGKWSDPELSTGEPIIESGKLNGWEAVGPVRDAWASLGPKIKDYAISTVETNISDAEPLLFEVYMAGDRRNTAVPAVLIISQDRKTRTRLRKAIQKVRSWTNILDSGSETFLECLCPVDRVYKLVMDKEL